MTTDVREELPVIKDFFSDAPLKLFVRGEWRPSRRK